MYKATILADSIANDQRITTAELVFPRFILAEVNTHRMFSRNSASSRAIPTEKIIERVEAEPFIPETFNKRVKGMGVGDIIENEDAIKCADDWLAARNASLDAARALMERDVDKSRVNRLLEPFMWHTAIITATDWDNFFALRDHPAAQKEFQIIAHMFREKLKESDPIELYPDEMHLPLVAYEDEFIEAKETKHWESWAWISAGRCARSSYDKIHNPEDKHASMDRAEKLKSAGHMSPFEHQARPFTEEEIYCSKVAASALPLMSPNLDESLVRVWQKSLEYSGNFRYWHQFRKTFVNEDNFALIG